MTKNHNMSIWYKPTEDGMSIDWWHANHSISGEDTDENGNDTLDLQDEKEVLTFALMLIKSTVPKLEDEDKQQCLEELNLKISRVLTDNDYDMGAESEFMNIINQNIMIYLSVICQTSVEDLKDMSEEERIALLNEKMNELRTFVRIKEQ